MLQKLNKSLSTGSHHSVIYLILICLVKLGSDDYFKKFQQGNPVDNNLKWIDERSRVISLTLGNLIMTQAMKALSYNLAQQKV